MKIFSDNKTENMIAASTSLEKLGSQIEYKERTAFTLEHILKVNSLIQVDARYINLNQISNVAFKNLT